MDDIPMSLSTESMHKPEEEYSWYEQERDGKDPLQYLCDIFHITFLNINFAFLYFLTQIKYFDSNIHKLNA